MWERVVVERRSLHLFVRMHFLRELFGGNEKDLPELRRRAGAQASAEGEGTIGDASESARSRTVRTFAWLCAGLGALNPHPTFRVELHLLPAPAESCRQRRQAIGR
jgi:hypothetical protein